VHYQQTNSPLYQDIDTIMLGELKGFYIVAVSVHMEAQRGPGRFKVKFTPAEDFHLMNIVMRSGPNDWQSIARQMPDRNARQCRERWTNYINPVLVSAPWTSDEENLLDEKLTEFGTRWHAIAIFFPTRSKNQIKNHWQSRQRRNVVPRQLPPDRGTDASVPEPPVHPADVPGAATTLWDAFFPGPEDLNWDDLFGPLF
jgi:hypothetical protein